MRFSNTLKVSPSDCVASNPQMKEETREREEGREERERESQRALPFSPIAGHAEILFLSRDLVVKE